jgi:hypothetical protein
LLTEQDLALLGSTFSRAYPIEDAHCFEQLLNEIDDADRHSRTARNHHRETGEFTPRPAVLGGGRR